MTTHRPIRPLSRRVYDAIMSDVWPDGPAAIVDFGLESQEHYEALYYPVRAGEVTLEALDQALGSGPKLTALVRASRSNPHKEIVFRTPYDVPWDEEPPAAPPNGGGPPRRFLVRTSCEYSVEIEAADPQEAIEKAGEIDFERHWTQAWAPFEAEEQG